MVSPIKITNVRLPESLYDELAQLAKDNCRSVNSEMVIAIRKYVRDARIKEARDNAEEASQRD